MATKVKCHLLLCFKLIQVHIRYGGSLERQASATYLVAIVTQLPWQPQCYVTNSFVLSAIELIFGMKLS